MANACVARFLRFLTSAWRYNLWLNISPCGLADLRRRLHHLFDGTWPIVESNGNPPPGYVAKSGSGPCQCRGSGFGLESCGEL